MFSQIAEINVNLKHKTMRIFALQADLFESCARQLHILHRCCLIICRSNGTEPMCSPASNYFDPFTQKLASFPCPPNQFDFCALMALSLCTKGQCGRQRQNIDNLYK